MFKLLLASIGVHISAASGPYYVGIKGSVTWFEAEELCREGVYIKATGGRLATWNNYDEFDTKVKAVYNEIDEEAAWIGLNDLGNGQYGGSGSEGDWHFIDGRDCGSTCLPKAAIGDMGLDEWGYGQPNEYHSEDGQDCGEIWNGVTDRAGNPNGVNDRNCQIQRSFICEFTNSIAPSGIGKQDIVAQINNNNNPLYGPLNNPSGENNYYVMEFTSITAIILFASVILNMVLIALVCYLGSTGCNRKATTARYSKVNMYATEDEKL